MGSVRDTSRKAFEDLVSSCKIGKQERSILHYLYMSNDPYQTLQEICQGTGLPINAVSGRVNGLKRKSLAIEWKIKKCSVTGRNVTPVYARFREGV
jgi:hypothetical protein